MEFGETLVALAGTIAVFSIPISIIWTQHRRKMLELQLRLQGQSDPNTLAAVEALRQEMRQLRDTTMQYDLSFDTALQRLEGRLDGLERRIGQAEVNNSAELRVGR